MGNVEFESILDTCIAEIRAGRATPEDCLQRYADHAPALEPLLGEATRLMMLPHVAMPDEAVDALERRALSKAAEIRATSSRNGPSVWRLFWSNLVGGRVRLVPAALSLVIAVVLASTWVVSASAASLPGTALYPVKLATERARLAVAFQHDARAELRLRFAERRLGEMQALLAAERPVAEGLLEALAAETTLALGEIEEMGADRQAEAAAKLLALTERQQAVLTSVRERVPEEAQKGLSRALEASQRGHDRAVIALSVAPTLSRPPSPIPTDTPQVKPTHKATDTPKPSRAPKVKPTHKATHTPKPTRTRQVRPPREPTHTPTHTPKARPTRKPTHTPKPTRTPHAASNSEPTRTPKPTHSRPGKPTQKPTERR